MGVRLGRLYFVAQALGGAVWWVAVVVSPPVRQATLGGLDPLQVGVFDVPLFVLASAVVAAGVRVAVWIVAPWTLLVTAALAAYATWTAEAGWGAVLMIGASAGTIAASALVLSGRLPGERLLRGPFAFRTARSRDRMPLLAQTGSQILLFWIVFLVAIPAAIVWIEQRWRLHAALPPAVPVAGLALLAAASALGLWSAYTMSTRGTGTPLPSAMPRRLVVAGPYRIVRNPMASASIAQGVAVGMIVGSWLVVVYAVCGALVWHLLIRPSEEADLAARFGGDYQAYRARVGLWLPRLRRTAPGRSATSGPERSARSTTTAP
ncbi:isoprenylcysteine carboxylmethyltransferase family protein [Microbacterium sp. NPDC096154]|uniref:methyltransferase family protein n=1 Tax=Microbacterium sp. NPDC096154 TaxID=3155549 RepID=UPI003327B3FF